MTLKNSFWFRTQSSIRRTGGVFPPVDPYDTLEPAGWLDGLEARAIQALSDPTQSAHVVGVNLDVIPFMKPAARRTAFRTAAVRGADVVDTAEHTLNLALRQQLGPLGPGDAYFAMVANPCLKSVTQTPNAPPFVSNLRFVRTFITDAQYDLAIYSRAIPAALRTMGLGGVVDTSPRAGIRLPVRGPASHERRR